MEEGNETLKKGEKNPSQENTLKNYTIHLDDMDYSIKISSKFHDIFYQIDFPEFELGTLALMKDIIERLIKSTDMGMVDFMDPEAVKQVKKKFKSSIEKLVDEELLDVDEYTKKGIIADILHRVIGLGHLDLLLADPELEEIVVNSTRNPIWVYHKEYGWMETNLKIPTEKQIQEISKSVARDIGKEVSILSPLLDAHLVNNDRVNAVLYPVADMGTEITIRKFAREPWTFTDFIKSKTVNSDLLALVWLAIQYELNILISGGTGSGKTSFMNVCTPFIHPKQRIISIEDTRELQLPKFLYWCPLKTRMPNPEGVGEITMLDLLVNALRMRPDRILVGEIRKQREAEILFEAMHTGHSVISTLHADTCDQTIRRLTNPPFSVPINLVEAVDLNIVMFRDRRLGIRRVFEVGEITMQMNQTVVNMLYGWNPRKDEMEVKSHDPLLFNGITLHTGLKSQEIKDDLDEKKKIIEWFVGHNINKVDDIGKIMKVYYLDKESVVDVVNSGRSPEGLLGYGGGQK
ncbi:type II/IV secretion system ATPase subunit [Candidatus Altiarchaeota archaeon]